VERKLEVFRRADGLWAWRLFGANGCVVAADGGDGFTDKAAAANTARQLLAGDVRLVADPASVSRSR
jgi:uncharacterized protein YegP (UPF0339 family)